jgi:uncharacterized membrane protein YccC
MRAVGALMVAYLPALLTAAALDYINPWTAGAIGTVSAVLGIIIMGQDAK